MSQSLGLHHFHQLKIKLDWIFTAFTTLIPTASQNANGKCSTTTVDPTSSPPPVWPARLGGQSPSRAAVITTHFDRHFGRRDDTAENRDTSQLNKRPHLPVKSATN
jgi:hypothetical protein